MEQLFLNKPLGNGLIHVTKDKKLFFNLSSSVVVLKAQYNWTSRERH